jgi:DNA-binding MarR family transcriptional regulator
VPRRADVSLLFDFFVAAQRLRRVLTDGLEESGMRPDEYAVYSLLLEKGPLTATEMAELLGMPLTTVLDYLKEMTRAGHLVRTSHPFDGRAVQLSLNRSGLAAQRRANRHWEVVRRQIEENLSVPVGDIRRALRALDDSAEVAGRRLRRTRPGSLSLASRR